METTFMTIHNLSPEANIQWASESITEVLGYQPDEVIGRTCFDYFHPDEIPFARKVHSNGVMLDKAAVLHYARIKSRDGQWVGCECVFTIVHDVLIACTSIYRQSENNERRAAIAPTIRRLFASSPKDPRYHMLEELSVKFRTSPQAAIREPRAALILNRFSRELFVLYATNAVSDILGVTPDQLRGKAFYECIQENCLPEAIRCLESAKANDSIAYLRFWYRNPRHAEDLAQQDENMQDADAVHSSDSEDGGVVLEGSVPPRDFSISGDDRMRHSSSVESHPPTQRTSSGDSSDADRPAETVFDGVQESRSSTSSVVMSPRQRRSARPADRAPEPFEIEAVISCTSDGLVVVLRRARPLVPEPHRGIAVPRYPNGLFAAPWGANPIRPHQFQADDPRLGFQHGLSPQPARQAEVGGPAPDQFMMAIREVAVFAWSLAGINGNIAAYGRGTPRGESQPPAGLPVWDPHAQPGYYPPENQAAQRWMHVDERTTQMGHESRLPYQFRWHQEQNLRYHPGYGLGLHRPVERPVQQGSWSGQAYRNPGYDVYYNFYNQNNHSRTQSEVEPQNRYERDIGNRQNQMAGYASPIERDQVTHGQHYNQGINQGQSYNQENVQRNQGQQYSQENGHYRGQSGQTDQGLGWNMNSGNAQVNPPAQGPNEGVHGNQYWRQG
ncbi:hypothetical protein PVAG01_01898 [Phlyctema vagabunda]|uniref:PAS domain-containing protein n=1 Tax=Phlyctema vagabunda TaxID=108571 RepID=A0ABR4PYC2_9HELO